MVGLNAGSVESGPAESSPIQVAVFGPQITHWTSDALCALRQTIQNEARFHFLSQTISSLQATLSGLLPLDAAVNADAGSAHNAAGDLEALQTFFQGSSLLDTQRLSNTQLAVLTVVAQTVDLLVGSSDGPGDLWRFHGAQGFCIGFLSAVALAASNNWEAFSRNVSNAIRLAACIGSVVDTEHASHFSPQQLTAVSVRWKTASDRATLETFLDSSPEVYISCVTDENALTVTLPQHLESSWRAQLKTAGIATSSISLFGSYHHPRHLAAAKTLKHLCNSNPFLQLPNADALRLSLRSTSDATVITAGSLHETAIDLILCRKAHWFTTLRSTVGDNNAGRIQLVAIGKDACIPRSLSAGSLSSVGEPSQSIAPSPTYKPEEIAVVGMACRFPRADSVEQFWELISSGTSCIGQVPLDRFDANSIGREPKLADFWGNFLRRADAFDHRFFGISGREAKSMDPQQRLVLQVAYEALESCGYHSLPSAEKEKDIGCYLGVGAVDYSDNVGSEGANAFSATGTLRAFISGRISHFFGWEGPSATFDTACSSSAVAIHTSCKALLTGECSMALAGGVSLITSPDLHQNLSAASFLSPNGASKAFDANADGYCRGEGAGLLVLKLLSKAVADGDHVIGVIAGSAVNQGSNTSPITVPDSRSQSTLYRRALSQSSLNTSDVTYVEAHGTGTQVGDPIEYESVRLAFSGPDRKENVFLGSVKDNIGHAEAASGVAGVIKTLLMIRNGIIPKQANFSRLNPRITSSDQITVPELTQAWTAKQRVALVNNYGAAGSNATIVLREDGTRGVRGASADRRLSSPAAYPIFLSAKSERSLRSYMDLLKVSLSKSALSLADVAYSLSRYQNPSFDYKISFTATEIQDLVDALDHSIAAGKAAKVLGKPPVVLCFGGQTGRQVTVSKQVYDTCDILRNHLNQCDKACIALGLPSIFPTVFDDRPIEDIVSLHCALLCVQVATARSWIDMGTEVDALVGHSFGQLSALCVAGSISFEDTLKLVSGRACLIRDDWSPESGGMLSVNCDQGQIEQILQKVNSTHDAQLDIACFNGSGNFVLAGSESSLAAAAELCHSFKTTKLDNTHAYHSYLAESIMDQLRDVADSIDISPPSIHVETCSTGSNWSRFTAEEIVQHTRMPVYFGEAIGRIATRLPSAIWIEAGSASPVIAMARRVLRGNERQDVFVPMDLSKESVLDDLANTACQLWQKGFAMLFWPFKSCDGQFRSVSLPPYQFEDSRHWIDYKPRSGGAEVAANRSPEAQSPSLVRHLETDTLKSEHLFSVETSSSIFNLAARGHAVTGQSLCPASMYVELAVVCAKSIQEVESAASVLPSVESLDMSAPLGLNDELAVFVRLKSISPSSWSFTIYSQPAGNTTSQTSTDHAKGRVNLTAADDMLLKVRLQLLKKIVRYSQVDRILSDSSTTGISGGMVYKLFSDVVEYADYYHGVRYVSAVDNAAVGSVRIPTERPLSQDSVICDPISVDNFLQVAGIHVNCLTPRKDGEVFVCTAVDEIVFTEAFMTNKLNSRKWTVYTRYERDASSVVANDILVYDANSKELVLAIMGADFRSVAFKSLARNLSKVNSSASKDLVYPDDSDDVSIEDSGYQTLAPSPDRRLSKVNLKLDGYFSGQPVDEALSRSCSQASTSISRQPADSIRSVCEMLSAIMEIPTQEIEPTSALEDLGIDSLLVTEVLTEVKIRFNVTLAKSQVMECADVRALCNLIQPDRTEDEIKPLNTVSESQKSILKKSKDNASDPVMALGPDTDTNLAATSRECFLEAKRSYDQRASSVNFSGYCTTVLPLQSQLVTSYVVKAFAALGCDLSRLRSEDEVPGIAYIPAHQKLVPQLYSILQDAGLIQKSSNNTYRRTSTPVSQVSPTALHERMLAQFPQHAAETKLLQATAPKLADCLTGEADPISLIFKDQSARMLLGEVYANAPMFKTGTLVLTQYLRSVVQKFDKGREFRILELGAGTGGTTKQLIESLSELSQDQKLSYTFTDLSPSLVAAARRKFADYSFLKYKTLDIEKDPELSHHHAYDLIISTNCIHATRDLVRSTTNIRKMLVDSGTLCLVELTRNLYWFDLVFGLLEGWWLFNDGRTHALAHEERWQQDLRSAGFRWIDWSDTSSAESDILRVIAASPSEASPPVRSPVASASSANRSASEKEILKETLTFKEADRLKLEADIFYPKDISESVRSLPVALMIHGGGHVMLSRHDVRPEQTRMLLDRGFLPISIDYRLCPEVTLSQGPVVDVADALAWIRTSLPSVKLSRSDIKADGAKVVSVGWSTGGMLAMSLAWNSLPRGIRAPEATLAFYCPTDYEDPFWVNPNYPVDPAAIDESPVELDDETWAGVFDNPVTKYNIPVDKAALGGWLARSDPRSRLALYMNHRGRTLDVLLHGLDKSTRRQPSTPPSAAEIAAISPLAQIRAGRYRTPTFIIHPRDDDLIPWQQAQRTVDALRDHGVPADLRVPTGVPHLFDIGSRWQRNPALSEAVVQGYDFLSRHVGLM